MATRTREPHTLPLTVGNVGFLLDRLGEDCHPLQFLRELTKNAIEAIQRAGTKDGQITWDVDWTSFELDDRPVYKLCVIDNGDGMTGEQMVNLINRLSSSLSEQRVGGNYGVGAKIAAATRNHQGLVYLSWKQGKGAMIHLWRDPETGQYGLRQFERPDGTFDHFAQIEDGVKPDSIRDHGTMVVLHGHAPDADTMQAPEGAPSPSRWIAKYLNTRFLRVPASITIRAREGWEHPRADHDRNLLRQVTGQEAYLAQHSSERGSVSLSNATAHWWILKNEPALTNNSGFVESQGHIAALYQDELYEMSTARAGRARLQNFGVLFGHNRVVIYLEPHASQEQRLTTNTARTQLLINNDALPWADWAAEFRDNMPEEIEQLMEEVAAGSSSADHTKSIRDRLKQIMDLYKISRYRLSPAGRLQIDEQVTSRGGQPGRGEASPPNSGLGRGSGRRGGTAGGVYSVFLKKDGPRGDSVQPDPFPDTRWVSVADGTRNEGDIEDRAARYLAEQNVLLINADFRVFNDLIDRWTKEFGNQPGIRDTVTDAVRAWFEQTLVETVIGVQALKGAKEWTSEDLTKAISEEALTAAVLPRYHVNNAVKRELGSKLGKLAS